MRTLLSIKVLETWSGAVFNERGPRNGFATDVAAAKRHAAPGPGRDNSVLLSRNNLLPPAFCIRGDPAANQKIRKKYMEIR
jgi:hypothetical protein